MYFVKKGVERDLVDVRSPQPAAGTGKRVPARVDAKRSTPAALSEFFSAESRGCRGVRSTSFIYKPAFNTRRGSELLLRLCPVRPAAGRAPSALCLCAASILV